MATLSFGFNRQWQDLSYECDPIFIFVMDIECRVAEYKPLTREDDMTWTHDLEISSRTKQPIATIY
jgi:hypothetical protein